MEPTHANVDRLDQSAGQHSEARPRVIVLGVGGVGAACVAGLVRDGCRIVVADRDFQRAEAVAALYPTLSRAAEVDISERSSIRRLVANVRADGPVSGLVLTAGVSPTQATVASIIKVDLVGTALVLDEFMDVLTPGGSAVIIASMAGQIFGPNLSKEDEQELSGLDPEALARARCITEVTDRATAYGYAKRGNQLRVRALAPRWGQRRLRLNSVSPGVIDTPMGRSEMNGDDAEFVRYFTEAGPIPRPADPNEIASAALFLLGRHASYITGTDLLVDGGATTLLT